MNDKDFWNKVGSKIGYDHSHIKYSNTAETGEKIFKEMILKRSTNSRILDNGCADGAFTLKIASQSKHIIGIDNSVEMIKKAQKNRKLSKLENVVFELMDANNLIFGDDTFDIVFSRRGPATSSKKAISESYRVLKHRSFFAEITIGEKDCQNIGKIFGRSQMMKTDVSVAALKRQMLDRAGFVKIGVKEFFYHERYATLQDLIMLLETTPIIPDFDVNQDSECIEKIRSLFGEKDIKISRHRVVISAEKPLDDL